MVYRFLLAAVGPHEADDCFQETFVAALRAYPGLRDGEALDRWVLRIATRKAIDAHRARGRRAVPTAKIEERAGHDDPSPDASGPVWDAVRALPTKQRVAVVHRHVLDRSYAEVAGAMGISEDAARANVSEGVRKLREALR